MADKTLKNRNEIDPAYKWDIEDMYPDESQWEKDIEECLEMAQTFASYRGSVCSSASRLLEIFQFRDKLWLKLEHAFVYARMRRDEDNTVEKYQAMTDKAQMAIAQVYSASSFFTPELTAAPEETIMGFIEEEPALEMYRFAIESTLRGKAHVLSAEEENIMAQLGEVLGAPDDIFTMLNNADLKFGTILDDEGDEVELTHGNYISFMESPVRSVRKDAFDHMYEAFRSHINTIGTTYNYNVKTDVAGARLRKYDSARGAALFSDNVDGSVYDNLIRVVNDNLPVLHRYIGIRKKLLGLDELKMWDVYVPLIDIPKWKVTFEEAVDLINKALAPMGQEYLDRMNAGIRSRWIDVCENKGKTSGAYSFGCYDSKPYILMNFAGTIKDVFTLIHEMGHSMHSSYTRENQPFVYGSHSIFTAEVASTVNESLLMRYLLDTEKDPEMQKYLINMYIEGFRTTLFRQTMFAEFEDLTHKQVESGDTLTAVGMCRMYDELNSKYFGEELSHDDLIQYEWARIPHFYSAFYVYKYATGYSAATAIASKILAGASAGGSRTADAEAGASSVGAGALSVSAGASECLGDAGASAGSGDVISDNPARDDYIEFLKTGDSDYPIELLKIAGVDMSTPAPVEDAMKVFGSLVDEFEQLVCR